MVSKQPAIPYFKRVPTPRDVCKNIELLRCVQCGIEDSRSLYCIESCFRGICAPVTYCYKHLPSSWPYCECVKTDVDVDSCVQCGNLNDLVEVSMCPNEECPPFICCTQCPGPDWQYECDCV